MMDENNFIDTWMMGLTMCAITIVVLFGGLYASTHPGTLIKVILISLPSIAVVVVVSVMLSKRLNNHRENKNGGAFIRVIYKFFARE